MIMMIVFITFNSSLVPLIEGVCSSNPNGFRGCRERRIPYVGSGTYR